MPAGNKLVNDVVAVLGELPKSVREIQSHLPAKYTRRAIRYAVARLVKEGKAQRKGQQGPIFAVKQEI